MYQSPNNFNLESDDPTNGRVLPEELIDNNNIEDLSNKHIIQRKKHLEKLFVYLIGFGVGLGLVLALIVTMALSKFGLLEKPYEIENQPQQTETLDSNDVRQL